MGIHHFPEQLTLLGQMALSKYKTETLEHIYECSSMTLLKIGNSKTICTLTHIMRNNFQNSMFLLMKLFFTQDPEYPLTFNLNLTRDTPKTCISSYCSQLPEHSHYDKTDLNPFFYRTLSKPIPQWFLAVETAMLQIYSTVYENTLRKINYISKTYHEGKPHPIGTFVLKRNFTDSDCLMLHMNPLQKMALQYIV